MSSPAIDRRLILSSEIASSLANPSISEMILTTRSGNVVLAINREQAEAMLDQLASFLNEELRKVSRR